MSFAELWRTLRHSMFELIISFYSFGCGGQLRHGLKHSEIVHLFSDFLLLSRKLWYSLFFLCDANTRRCHHRPREWTQKDVINKENPSASVRWKCYNFFPRCSLSLSLRSSSLLTSPWVQHQREKLFPPVSILPVTSVRGLGVCLCVTLMYIIFSVTTFRHLSDEGKSSNKLSES